MPSRVHRRSDARTGLSFTVEIEGLSPATFLEVSGIALETDVVEIREGTGGGVRKSPGLMKFPNVTLKRGYSGNTDLFDWATGRGNGADVTRRTVIVTLTNRGREIASWTLHRAWPVKWTAPDLNASGNDVALESIELAHEGITTSA